MKNQKTIAKWLAVILLLTIAVACYIILSAVLTNKTDAFPSGVAGAGDAENSNPSDVQPQPPAAVYSQLPREATKTDSGFIAHIGGENDDEYLSQVSLNSRRYVLFKSASTQYDVKQSGIHIAILQDSALIGTTFVCGSDRQFVLAKMTKYGLLILTRDSDFTYLDLYDSSLSPIAAKKCARFESYKIYQNGGDIRLYAADKTALYSLSISSALEVAASRHTYPVADAEIAEVITSGNDGVFLQTPNGVEVLSFDKIDGFKLKFELLNCRYMQIEPSLSDGKQITALLASSAQGISINRLDETLAPTSSALIEGATAAAILKDGDNFKVVANDKAYIYCSHLEPQGSYDLSLPCPTTDASYFAVPGENGLIKVVENDRFYLVKISGKTAEKLYEADFCGNLPSVIDEGDGNYTAFFSSDNPETFGGADIKTVFIVTKQPS